MSVCDLTEKLAIGDGSTLQFPFQFKYQNESDISVALYDNSIEQWVDQPRDTWTLNTLTTVLFDTAPPASATANVKIYRITDITDLEAEFFPGSAIRAEDLNNNFQQLQYAIQEVDCNSSGNEVIIDDLQDQIDQNAQDISDLDDSVTQNESDIADNAANISTNADNIAINAGNISQNTSDIAANTAELANRWNKTDETTQEAETWVADDATVATTGAIEQRILTILDDPTAPTGGYWNKDGDTIDSSKNWSPSDNTVGTTKAIDDQLTPIKNDVSTNAGNINQNASDIANNATDIANRWNKTSETVSSGWTSSNNLVATTQAIRDTFAAVTTSTVPPNNPVDGDLWLNSNTGVLYFYYEDINSSQWISVSTGPEGPSGADGANATVDVGFTNTGTPGSFASVANSGTTQNAVFNFTIPRGQDGTDGTDGDDGQSATIAVGTTSTRAPGTGATVINTGTNLNAVFDFGIPRGADGADGADGNAAVVSVGNTITGSPGTNAEVTNTGTQSYAVFDFKIPRGDQGIQGIQGEPGLATPGSVPPSNPVEGMLWFNNINGVTYIYYNDGNSSQWVSTSNSYSPAVAGYGNTKPTNPVVGQLYYDTDDSELQLWSGSSWIST